MFVSDNMARGLITVVAAGEIGNRVAAGLGSLFGNILCHTDLMPLDVISCSMAASDLILVVSGLEDEVVAGRAADFAGMARDSHSCRIVIGLVTKSSVGPALVCQERVEALRCKVDALFMPSNDCLISMGPDASEDMQPPIEEHLVRLLAGEVINLNSDTSVDLSDIKAIMCDGGSEACLGVGIAKGENGGKNSALKALQALRFQEMDLTRTGAFIVSVTGSPTNLTMENFAAAHAAIKGAIHENANFFVVPLFDEALAGTVRVTIMAKRNAIPLPAPEMTPQLAAFLADFE